MSKEIPGELSSGILIFFYFQKESAYDYLEEFLYGFLKESVLKFWESHGKTHGSSSKGFSKAIYVLKEHAKEICGRLSKRIPGWFSNGIHGVIRENSI